MIDELASFRVRGCGGGRGIRLLGVTGELSARDAGTFATLYLVFTRFV